jgi:hypothetical protein
MTSRGFICAATSHEYARLAYGLALSARVTHQIGGFSIVVSDKEFIDPEWRKVFDHVAEIKPPENANKFYLRSFFHQASPYDYTVALDADMVFARNLGQWWDLMEEGGRPIVMSQAMTYRSVPITDRRFRKVFDDAKLLDAYSALFMFDKSDTSKELFSILNQMLGDWKVWRGVLPSKWSLLQPGTTDVSLGIALKLLGLKSAFTGWRPKFVHLKPEIQDNTTVDNVEAKLCLSAPQPYHFSADRSIVEVERIKQIYPVHYFKKEWLTSERLTTLEESYDALRKV